jgi:hypothetical protein
MQIKEWSNEVPLEVVEMLFKFHENLANTTDSNAVKASSLYWLANSYTYGYGVEKNRGKALEKCFEAAKLGHRRSQSVCAMRCLRDPPLQKNVDQKEFDEWTLQALTGNSVFEILPSQIQKTLDEGFKKMIETPFSEDLRRVFAEFFVLHVIGTHLPRNTTFDREEGVFHVGKKEYEARTVAEFKSSSDLGTGLDMLYHLALFGNEHVIRELASTENLDLDAVVRRGSSTEHTGMTALQIAFLRHNTSVVSALIDLSADVMTLFEPSFLSAIIRNGDRWSLHFLNHLILLMQEHSQKVAREAFDAAIAGTQRSPPGLQMAIHQNNWQR